MSDSLQRQTEQIQIDRLTKEIKHLQKKNLILRDTIAAWSRGSGAVLEDYIEHVYGGAAL